MKSGFRGAAGAPLVAALLTVLSVRPAGAAPLMIGTDTVWEGSVAISGEAQVAKGATLVILPGTTVRFAAGGGNGGERARLLVNGTLVAQGTREAPILFTSAAREPRPGDWDGVVLEHARAATNRISQARIEYATVGVSGSYSTLRAEELTLRNNETGLAAHQEFHGSIIDSTVTANAVGFSYYQSGAFEIEHCEITGNAEIGVGCLMGSSPHVRRSLIADNGETGVGCVQGSSPVIEGNTIRGHRRGVFVELQSKPLITRNIISGNDTGIWNEKYAFPRIVANAIGGNGVGVYCNFASYPQITANNIEDNRRFAVVLGDSMSIKVEKLIPFRGGGSDRDAPPPTPELLPPQTRKFAPFAAGDEGLVDARGNWWGAKVTAEMERLGEDGNVSVIEDFHDKPDTFYRDQRYPRDKVRFSPWEPRPVAGTEPPPSPFAKISGTVLSGGSPVAGVRVHAYADESRRGAGFAYSAPTAADGGFVINLPPGSYFLVVKGPPPAFPAAEPAAGAFFGVFAGNPLAVSPGTVGTAVIEAARRKAE